MKQVETIETKRIVVQLMGIYDRTKISTHKLIVFMEFLHTKLFLCDKLHEYEIAYDLNKYSIENFVNYNDDLFFLDLDYEYIRLKATQKLKDLIKKYELDETLTKIIRDFHKADVGGAKPYLD